MPIQFPGESPHGRQGERSLDAAGDPVTASDGRTLPLHERVRAELGIHECCAVRGPRTPDSHFHRGDLRHPATAVNEVAPYTWKVGGVLRFIFIVVHSSVDTQIRPICPAGHNVLMGPSPRARIGHVADFPISERTREGLAKARALGKKLGRPKGALGVSRLDGKEDDIRRFLELGVSKTAIAKITGVSRTSLYSFMRTRGLKPSP